MNNKLIVFNYQGSYITLSTNFPMFPYIETLTTQISYHNQSTIFPIINGVSNINFCNNDVTFTLSNLFSNNKKEALNIIKNIANILNFVDYETIGLEDNNFSCNTKTQQTNSINCNFISLPSLK